ncbi:hypothetical protein [Paracoccus alcaliphilus]|nr:hypothetical protein [Paracoccus alcaliphilus]WCR18986.1 hypothetical protein JHW40_04590 [Paracoccus alcaliphilus]
MTPPAPTVTPVELIMSRGQSLSAGPNPGDRRAPDGRTWHQVFAGNDRVQALGGLRYPSGNPITQIGAPLAQGYDHSVTTTGSIPMPVRSFITEGAVIAHGLVREGLTPGRTSHQWHDIGGMSVASLDNDPATGAAGQVTPWQSAEYWLTQAMIAYRDAESVVVPRICFNQGEADLTRPRGWWRDAFRVTYGQMIEQIQRIVGQQTAPRLYLRQTGGYGHRGSRSNEIVLDQIEVVREWDGILVGPNWCHLVDNYDNRMVHMSIEGHIEMSEMYVWAIAEVESGRGWNLLPGQASRAGDIITIPISTRPDEELITVPGRYEGYGGDPAHLGLEAVGGQILSAAVSGENILLQVSGPVTAIRHAMQNSGVDYRTHLDANGYGYVEHRSLLRTTLTKTVTLGGQDFTLERWLPSFQVELA